MVVAVVAAVAAMALAVVHETVYFQVLHQCEFLGVRDGDYRDSILWF